MHIGEEGGGEPLGFGRMRSERRREEAVGAPTDGAEDAQAPDDQGGEADAADGAFEEDPATSRQHHNLGTA